MYRMKRKAAEAEMRLLAASSAGGNSGGSPRRPRLRRRTAAAAAAAGEAAGSDTGSRSAGADQQLSQQPQHTEQRSSKPPAQQRQQQAQRAGQLTDTASHLGGQLSVPQPLATPTQVAARPASAQHHRQQQQLLLADLQLRVLEDAGISGHSARLATTLHSAHRAQAATPPCAQRAVLAVLPRMRLQLSQDPHGMEHEVACLLEAVTPGAVPPEQEGDSQAPPGGAAPRAAAGEIAVRLTVFAAAGAVPCWHEAPAEPDVALSFSPLTRTLSWAGGGFALRFPGPTCPQVDLFTAVHHYVGSSGSAALEQSILSLGPAQASAPPAAPAAAPAATHAARDSKASPAAAKRPRRAKPAAKPKPAAKRRPAATPAYTAARPADVAPSLGTPSQGAQPPQPPSITSPEAHAAAGELIFAPHHGSPHHGTEHWSAGVGAPHGAAHSDAAGMPLAGCLGLGDVGLDCGPLLFDSAPLFDPASFDMIFTGL